LTAPASNRPGSLPSSLIKRRRKALAISSTSSPRSRRGQIERDDRQPVEEILAKAPFGHFQHGIAVGGADDADIDRLGRAGPHRLDAARLQETQQLDLKADVHLADFIEKQRAAIGRAHGAGVVVDGAGKGPLAVAEQFRFQQVFRDRAAIDRDERPLLRWLQAWIASAATSLPVPLSPVMKTVALDCATLSIA
jgi:hypothetical protein